MFKITAQFVFCSFDEHMKFFFRLGVPFLLCVGDHFEMVLHNIKQLHKNIIFCLLT